MFYTHMEKWHILGKIVGHYSWLFPAPNGRAGRKPIFLCLIMGTVK